MPVRATLIIFAQLLLTLPRATGQNITAGIVISQVYGGGGNSGATLRNDFIELFNRGTAPVTVTGWTAQYASTAGSSWDRTLLNGTIQPGQYYLISEAQGSGGTSPLPAPDSSGSINLSATDGKVALVSNSINLSGTNPMGPQIIDVVGYGNANFAEGSPAAALDNRTAATRDSSGCTDTNNNRADFSRTSPAPRNSHSPLNLCTPVSSKPDLVLTALSAPAMASVGGTLSPVAATVKNQGAAAAGPFRMAFFLSPVTSITATAVSTGNYCSVSTGLAAATTFTCTSSLTVPTMLAPGTWYVLAVADDQNQIDESDENNNSRPADTGPLTITAIPTAVPTCGTERWPVKTGSDADAKFINLGGVTPTTIPSLASISPPADKPENNRIPPTETTVFALNATLTLYKLEDDSDYHLVLADPSGKTMIAEIPSPACTAATSPLAPGISTARSEFDLQFKVTTDFKTVNLPVKVTGIGFFDFLHSQTGVAPNGIELHPVLDIRFPPTITSVSTAGGFPDIAPNDWIEIHGVFAPDGVSADGLTWSTAPEFASGRMPTQLRNITVTVGSKPAYIYYISPFQINALTPVGSTAGAASIVVAHGSTASAPFNTTVRTAAPSFLLVGSTNYVVATHADGSLLGPASLSVPGYTFSPAEPGETVVLYGVGFGLPATPLAEGAATQSGMLPDLPVVQIGGTPAVVQFAGVISPGVYQFNVVMPNTAQAGDNAITAIYNGAMTPAGSAVSVKQP